MKLRLSFLLFITIAILLVFSGCSEGERGIFATIAIEEEIKKGNLPDDTGITGLEWGSFNSGDRLVVGVGKKIFTRSVNGGDWDEISPPGSRRALFVAARYDSTNTARPELGGDKKIGPADEIYVVFYDYDSDGTTIYQLSSTLGWNPVYTGTSRINGMVGVDDVLFVTTLDADLLIWNSPVDGTPDSSLTWDVAGEGGVTDGVRNGADGSAYYLVAADGTISHVDAGLGTRTSFTVDADLDLGGVGFSNYSGDEILAVTDADGVVYLADSSADPGDPTTLTWESSGALGRRSRDVLWLENRHGGRFLTTTFQYNRQDDPLPRGYYEAEVAGADGAYNISGFDNNLGNNYEASDLSIASINQFLHFVIGGADLVLALTGGRGLWSTFYPATGDPTWRWE